MEKKVTVLRGVVGALLGAALCRAAASYVKNADSRNDAAFFSEQAYAAAEVDVFIIQKEALVKAVDRKKVGSWNGECRAACPRGRSYSAAPLFLSGNPMVLQESKERDRVSGAPCLGCFGLNQEFGADDADRRTLREESREPVEISGEKERIGVYEEEDATGGCFGGSIDGKSKSSVFRRGKEVKRKALPKRLKRVFLVDIVICNDAFVRTRKFQISN